MNRMKVAIVDDEKVYCDRIKNKIESYGFLFIIDTFYSAKELIEKNESYDICLLDIEMPQMDGIELSKHINKNMKLIIYITSMKERMIEAFGMRVFGFILKEEIENRLIETLENAVKEIEKEKIVFPIMNGTLSVLLNEIYYIQIQNRRIYLYTETEEYKLSKMTLKTVAEKLNDDFIYIDQSCIVNIVHIQKAYSKSVVLDNGIELNISKGKQKEFKISYMRRLLND